MSVQKYKNLVSFRLTDVEKAEMEALRLQMSQKSGSNMSLADVIRQAFDIAKPVIRYELSGPNNVDCNTVLASCAYNAVAGSLLFVKTVAA